MNKIRTRTNGGERTVSLLCVGGGGVGAYPLTKEHFQLQKDKLAFKLGNNEDCNQLLPALTETGKLLTTLTAY